MRAFILLILVSLQACGGTEPDFYEQDGKCYAKRYFNGSVVIETEEYVAYPGKCE